ncbi:hypothetical protein HAX39_17555 [Citrobacter freundii]|nr:hypothetical protein [Citrobacter freundii]
MKKYITGIVAAYFFIFSYALAIPPPIDLGIQNIPQMTPVWCWAAVAQQIIYRLNPGSTPQQCQLVAEAYNANPQICCNAPASCMATGSLQQIQHLISNYSGHSSTITPPANPMAIYQTLASGRAIIMQVRSSPYSNHVIVIRGMAWVPTPMGIQPVLYINDPMAYFTQPILFSNLAMYWLAAIVVN